MVYNDWGFSLFSTHCGRQVLKSGYMDNNKSMRKWTDLYGLAVVTGGKRVGTVDDFYLEPESNAVRALRIKVGVLGYRELQASAISSIERDRITIANEYM